MTFIIPGTAIPKPQGLKRRPLWKEPKRVKDYRMWQDAIRWMVRGKLNGPICEVGMVFFLPRGNQCKSTRWHAKKPDLDNLVKGTLDALTTHDETIAYIRAEKYYDDGRGPRLVLDIN